MPYVRLLRLPDQYIQFGAAIAAGLYTGEKSWWIFSWAIATTFISFSAFIANELTDRNDVDRYSWNPLHVRQSVDSTIAWIIAVLCAVIGLFVASKLSLLWWAVGMLVLGLAYSLEPIRFKRRFLLDTMGQLVVWWAIPFIAPLFSMRTIGPPEFLFALTMAFLQWGLFLPYQLADFEADRKVGFTNTHVTLGMKRSLTLGRVCVIGGVFLYVLLGYYRQFLWSLPFAVAGAWMIGLYNGWLRLAIITKQTDAMQRYILRFKPVSQVMAIVYFLLWRTM